MAARVGHRHPLSARRLKDFTDNIDFYRQRIVLRPQEISNHPELVRRLGVIAMNDDRGRHLRQREQHPPHGQRHDERHWRLGRLCAQRLPVVLCHAPRWPKAAT